MAKWARRNKRRLRNYDPSFMLTGAREIAAGCELPAAVPAALEAPAAPVEPVSSDADPGVGPILGESGA
jgi:hypothetical protein